VAIGDIIVGLDLGATKISCVIGQVNKFSEIEVIGYGLSDSSGIKKGRILKEDSLKEYFTLTFKGGGNSSTKINYFTEYLLPDLAMGLRWIYD